MKHNLHTVLLTIVLALFCQARLYSQANCNSPGTICNNPSFNLAAPNTTALPGGLNVSNPGLNPQTGNGANPAAPRNNGCLYNNGAYPQWLVISVTSSGNLGFRIGSLPSCPQTNFLHWSMWPYTPTTCSDIINNTLAPVACNYNCTSAGGTGMGNPGSGNPCNYQPSIPVTAGQQYIILISNVGGAPACVSFTSTGSAGIACNPLTIPSITACPGQIVTTTASWFGASGVSYTLTGPAGSVPAQTSPNFTVSGALGGPYVYTVNATGTNSYGQPISATQNFTLTITPTQTMAVSHATDYCYGSTASLVVTPGQGTFNIAGPSCCLGQLQSPSTSNTIVISPMYNVNAGVYTITANFTTGCTGSYTTQINVAPNSFINVSSNVNVCQGGNATLTASMPSATSYTWVGPNTFSVVVPAPAANGNIPLSNVQPTAAGVYTVYANINYNTVACPRQATTQVSVVQTYSINAPQSYTYCQGEQACLTATVGGNPTSFSWAGPNGFSYTSPTNPNTCITNSVLPADAGAYIIQAYFSNGFVSCTTSTISNVYVVQINPVSVLVPSLICQYATANMAVSAPGASTYYWHGPNNFTANVVSPVIVNIQPPASGDYTVDVIYALGTKTCGASGHSQITVIPVNSITVVSPVVVCYPQNVDLFSSSIGATNYQWTGPNNYTANAANTTIYYAPLNATGVYTVTTTYTTGGLTCFNNNTVNVSVNPVMSFTLPQFINTCYNTPVTINGPGGATSYTWTSTTGYTANTQNATFTSIQPSDAGNYMLSLSLGPCVSSRNVDVYVLTPLQFTLTPQGRSICRGDTILLEAGATGGSEVYAYSWVPSADLSSPTGPVVTGLPLGTTVFNLNVHDVACPNYTLSYPFTVVVKQPPEPKLYMAQTQGCEPLCLTYDTQTKNDAAITTFDFGGVLQMQADSGILKNYCLTQPGIYNLRIHSEGTNGCIGTYDYPEQIVVFPKSKSDITWTPEVPTSNENLVTFSSEPKSGSNVVSYSWMFSGTEIPYDTTSEKNPQRKYENTGKFPLMLISTTDKGCIDTTIEYIEIRDDLSLFIPNTFTPNNDGINDYFMVKGVGFKPESFSLEIFDRWGHSGFLTKDIMQGWDGTIKGQKAAEGVYIYRVRIVGSNGEGRKEYIGHVTLIK